MKHFRLTIRFTNTDTWHTDFYGYNIFDAMRRNRMNGYTNWIKAHPQKCKFEVIG